MEFLKLVTSIPPKKKKRISEPEQSPEEKEARKRRAERVAKHALEVKDLIDGIE